MKLYGRGFFYKLRYVWIVKNETKLFNGIKFVLGIKESLSNPGAEGFVGLQLPYYDSMVDYNLIVSLKKANVTINKLIDELKLINIPNNKIVYVIDKKSLYGLQSEFITIENCPFEIEEEQKKLFKEKNSLFLFNESIVDINDMQIISKIDKFEKNFGIIGKSIFNISNLKSMDVVTRLYEYYFKQNNKKNIQMKTGMNVNLYDINANITMSDIEVINHFVDNNIDEKSPIFSEEEAIFNNIDLDIKFNQNSEINLDMFKMFNDFFKESNKLEKINEKLPGYDNEITYDSEYSNEEEDDEQTNN